MRREVKKVVEDRIKEAFKVDGINFKVEEPRDPSLGDLATNVSFLLAKTLKRNPNDIAQDLARILSEDSMFEEVSAVRGFVNFKLSPLFIRSRFRDLLKEGEGFFKEDVGKGTSVQVEFVSANPTGPLHLGHGRGAVVGDTLARLLEFFGFKVTREYYINDAGRQVFLLGVSVFVKYLELQNEEIPKSIQEIYDQEGYKGEYITDIAKSLSEAVGSSLTSQKPEEIKKVLLEKDFPFPLEYLKKYDPKDEIELCSLFGLDMMMAEIRRTLSKMNVSFDSWVSEREIRERGLVEEVLNILKEKDLVYEKEGALWLKTSEFGDSKDRVLVKSDGELTYFASDIAYHLDKFRRGFQKVIDLWGADHHGYIPRVKASLKMLDIPEDWLEVYLIQMVKLFRDGKEVKMSKRAGNFVLLEELIDEVGQDAVRFVFLTKRSDTPLDFDVDKVKEKSSDNPVYYVQYAHARISGVFREVKSRTGFDPEREDLSPFVDGLKEEAEVKLMKKCLTFKDEILDIVLSKDPHHLPNFLIDLASDFHNYYNHYRVLGSEESIMRARLSLLKGVREVIRLGLKLMGVSAPDRM